MSSKLIKTVVIGGALIGAAFLTGGAALIPAISSAGVGGIGAFAVAGGLSTTFLGGLALTAGGSILLGGVQGALQKTPKASLSTIDRLNASLVPSTPRKMVWGRTAMATDIRYVEPSGTDQEYLDYIIAVAAHRVEAITEIVFEDVVAWTAAGGVQGKYAGYLTVDVRTEGASSNTIAINGGGKWGSAHRLTGCAYVHLRLKRTGNSKKAESPLVGGLPSRLTIIGNGMRMYDPRYDSTVGGSGPMRVNDQSTWAYTYGGKTLGTNPALQTLNYLLGWRINGKLSVGRGIPVSRIDLVSFMVAANLCDEGVTKVGGAVVPRYVAAGIASEADEPQNVFGVHMAACNGRLRDSGGKLSIWVAHNDLAAAASDPGLNDDDVLSGFDWNPDPSLGQSFNIVRGRYIDPSPNSLYQAIDYPEVKIASVDGIDRVMTLDLLSVDDAARAQRIAKQVLQRKQYERSFSATFGANAWRYQVGDIVPLTFAALGFTRRLFRVQSQTVQMDGTCPMVLTEENAAIYAWDKEETAEVQAAEAIRYDAANNPLILGIDQAGTTAIWSQVADDGGKPEDGADVTANHTSADSNALGGINAVIVLAGQAAVAQAVQDNADAIVTVRTDLEGELAAGTALQDSVNTSLQTQVNGATASITSQGLTIAGHTGSLASQDTRITTATNNANSALAQVGTLTTTVTNNNTAATSQISTLFATLRESTNLQVNGGFANGLEGIFSPNPDTVTYNNVIWGRVFQYTANGNSHAFMPPVNVFPGGQYTVSFGREFAAASGSTRISVNSFTGLNATGTEVYDAASSPSLPAGGFGEGRRSFTFTVPAGVNSIRLRLVSDNVTGAIASAWRQIQVEAGSNATPFRDDATAINQYALVTQHSGTLVTLAGKTQAFWQVTAQVPGQRTQMTIRADGDGGGGVDIDGDVRIKGAVTILGIIRANGFVTDQGVDLAAVVPGSFNWLTSGGQTLNTSLGAGSTTGANVGSGIVNVGGQKVTVNFAMTSNAGAGAGTTIFRVTLLRSVAGGGWAGVIVLGDINPTNVSSSKSLGPVVFTMGNFGPTQFAIDIQNIGDKGGGVQVVNYNMEGAFFK